MAWVYNGLGAETGMAEARGHVWQGCEYGLWQGCEYSSGAGTAWVGVGQGSLHISLRLAVCMATRSLQSYESVHVNTSNSS